MTITRPLSLPVIHPPSISSISIPGMRMNMHGQEEDQFEDEPLPRPRNASFDVPLLQRTLATLQEQVGLLTPPESVANVDTHSRTPSRRGSDSTRLSAGTVTKLQTLVNSMFDLLVSRIGQKVDITAFTDTVEALLMHCLHHDSRLMLLSSPPKGKNDLHSWMLVAPGVKTSERKWKRRQSGAYDYSSVLEVPSPPPRRPKPPPKKPSHASVSRQSSMARRDPTLRSSDQGLPQQVQTQSIAPLHIVNPTPPKRSDGAAPGERLDGGTELGEWQKLMMQRQQGIPQWQGHRATLMSDGKTAPSVYLKTTASQADSPPSHDHNPGQVDQNRRRSAVPRPRPPTAYNGSPHAPSASSSGSLLEPRTQTPGQQSVPSAVMAPDQQPIPAERVEHSNPARGFVMRVPAPSKPNALSAEAGRVQADGRTPTTMYYTAPTHPPTAQDPRSGIPSTMYHTAPTHISEPNGHMLFSHEHFDVPVAEPRKDSKFSSLVSKITSKS